MADELVFLKLGGSLLTEKAQRETARHAEIERLSQEIAAALQGRPGLRLVVGHGSGSFGHFYGRKYGTRAGVRDARGWYGFAATAAAAARLNRIVTDALLAAQVPAWSLPPSASALCEDGELQELNWMPIRIALNRRLAPVVFGDVALDSARGGTIVSTEEVFAWLALRLHPDRVILAGEVDGVYTQDPATHSDASLLPEVTLANLRDGKLQLGHARGLDVTGGMYSKVAAMLELVRQQPTLRVQIINGLRAGCVQQMLVDPNYRVGTVLRA